MKKLVCYLVLFALVITVLEWMMFKTSVTLPYKNTRQEPALLQVHGQEKLQEKVYMLLKNYYNTYQRCTDFKSVADPNRTQIRITGTDTVNLGGSIRLNVYLFDGYGKTKRVGGDHLRARLFTESKNAYTVGTVYDYKNGTYLIHFTALWAGPATAEIEMLYPSEIMAAALYTRSVWDFSELRAVFTHEHTTERTSCSPNITVIKQRQIAKRGVCDFSYWNRTMPWYCVKPSNVNMSCANVVETERTWNTYTRHLNKCEYEIARRPSVIKRVSIRILPKRSTNADVSEDQLRRECTNYNITELWYNTKPTGYFYEGKWTLRHCKGISTYNGECFRNKSIYFWGDSTVYQWFIYIRNKEKCVCKQDSSAIRWFTNRSCYCSKHSFSLIWMPHIMSFILHPNTSSTYFQSLLQQLGNHRRCHSMECILVVHLYSHIQMYNLKFIADHFLKLREDIETLLKYNIRIKVFIKLPHTHREYKYKEWMIRQPDFLGYFFTYLLRTIFTGLHHLVIVLNNSDATNAIKNHPLHPSGMVVSAMIGQLQSYVCKMSDVTSR